MSGVALGSGRIRASVCQYRDFPRKVLSEITEDSYTLFAPVASGKLSVFSGGRPLFEGNIRPGMLRVACPGERTDVVVRSAIHHVQIIIPGAEFRRIVDGTGFRRQVRAPSLRPLIQAQRHIAAIALALSHLPHFDQQRQLYIDGLAHSLVACVLDGQNSSSSVRLGTTGKSLSDGEFDRCVQYARAKLEGRLDLAAWAGVVGMSASEFNRRFVQRTHQTPYAWFVHLRIERAKELLRDRRVSIADAAFSVGFCSQSHFTEAFRRRVGCSPGRWRVEACAQDPDNERMLIDRAASLLLR